MPVHPYSTRERHTALNALATCRPEILGVGEGALRSGVVHRLDVDTSGVLVFATAQEVWERLRSAFRERRMVKVYRAIVAGRAEGEGHVEVGMVVARRTPARVRVTEGGRRVELTWRALETVGEATLVEVRPRTGFLHQIRAALAHLGHPLVGDVGYGGPDAPCGIERHLLHASRLEGAGIAAAAPDPADFQAALAELRAVSIGPR
jgi:23S rRNA pseudouridine1911/1915/1917 synthase